MSQAFGTKKHRVVATGEVIANEGTPVVTACTAFAVGDFIEFTIKTVAGATELPLITSTTASVGFTTVNAAGTTSTYYYAVKRLA